MATSHKEPIGAGKEGEVEVEFRDDGYIRQRGHGGCGRVQ